MSTILPFTHPTHPERMILYFTTSLIRSNVDGYVVGRYGEFILLFKFDSISHGTPIPEIKSCLFIGDGKYSRDDHGLNDSLFADVKIDEETDPGILVNASDNGRIVTLSIPGHGYTYVFTDDVWTAQIDKDEYIVSVGISTEGHQIVTVSETGKVDRYDFIDGKWTHTNVIQLPMGENTTLSRLNGRCSINVDNSVMVSEDTAQNKRHTWLINYLDYKPITIYESWHIQHKLIWVQ